MNKNAIEILQLDEVKKEIEKYCVSPLGRELIQNTEPSSSINIVKRRMRDNKEAKNIIKNSTHIPLEGIYSISDIVEKAKKGITVEPSELHNVEDFLRGCRKIKKFMESMKYYGENISEYALNISECPEIEEEISVCIKNGRVSSDASRELKRTRAKIEICEEKIKEKLSRFMMNSENKKYIQEFIITKRSDRYVIPMKAAYKNNISGTVVDVSSSGGTVFVEPSSISKYTSEMVELKAIESIEEYRILSEITDMIYSRSSDIDLNIEILSEYDMLFAKAKYSLNNNCISPKINEEGYINICKGVHPLIGKDAVPMDVVLGKDYRSLVITGPNAGGKTVALKTIGLLSMMVQCGFDIKADSGTEIAVFDDIFVDIGDNQSIENSLSTFSSHIKNISDIIRKSGRKSLVILDEIGSGTEPNEGAGLAIAVLEELYKKGCIIAASTHYGEIKRFAQLHPDFENAGMMFDKETLEPMYRLVIGKSEDSNALFISKKMGISEKVLGKARRYIDNKEYDFDVYVPKNKPESEKNKPESKVYSDYEKGDRVEIIETREEVIVYSPCDKFNNIEVYENGTIKKINIKQVRLRFKKSELYPEGYDIDSLFVDYRQRKLEHDIQRGSKKTLKKIQKEIKESRKRN